jgi:hypothetical protein
MIFTNDKNGEKIILSNKNQQVMMEWEKPYMEESINFLSPKGDVLEIGFGCGYSATQIMKHPIKSYTIVECEPIIIEKINKWKKDYEHIPITIVEGTWQNKLHTLGIFDEIYFDDFPLNIDRDSTQIDIAINSVRSTLFINMCIHTHTRIGSKISMYLNKNKKIKISSDSELFVKVESKTINIKIPNTCKYRDLKEQLCTIPLITKIKEYNFEESQRYVAEQLNSFGNSR